MKYHNFVIKHNLDSRNQVDNNLNLLVNLVRGLVENLLLNSPISSIIIL
jgi:hypothetical protein